LIQLFRRENCVAPSQTVRLFGLVLGALYTVTDCDTDRVMKITGQELTEKGLTVEIKDKPGAAVILYRKAK
jgi:hypothetical protein